MSDILNKNIVLVLNRNWQAINIRTPALGPKLLALNPTFLWLGCGVSAVLGALVVSLEGKANQTGFACEEITEQLLC